jgi:hypothetical protein
MLKRYFLVGVAVLFVLFVLLRFAFAPPQFGLTTSSDEIRMACGEPQSNAPYILHYVDGKHDVQINFTTVEHKTYLNAIRWRLEMPSVGSGVIAPVTKDKINEAVRNGSLPGCLSAVVN